MNRIIAAVLAATTCRRAAQAQAPAAEMADRPLTPAAAPEAAGAPAPDIDAASAGLRAAEAQRRVAGMRPNPSIDVEAANLLGTGGYRPVGETETPLGLAPALWVWQPPSATVWPPKPKPPSPGRCRLSPAAGAAPASGSPTPKVHAHSSISPWRARTWSCALPARSTPRWTRSWASTASAATAGR